MTFLNKLLCMAVGHKALQIIEDDFPKMYHCDVIEYKSSIWRSTTRHGERLHCQIFSIPYDMKASMCTRCSALFWHGKGKTGYLGDISMIPGLQEFNQHYKRFIWEKHARSRNYVADQLYKQYLMALKLGSGGQRD